jgi:hypothetical protein
MKELVKEWDKTFKKSDKVNHKKVTFMNRFGIEIVADQYEPIDYTGKLPAISVCGPYGAVKEQCSGLYAMELASRGFLTIAFDPSFTGESGGHVRYMSSPDINTEDFQASIDYLLSLDNVDEDKVGILGICGWGGIALNTAALDTRIKATIVSTMYDLSRVSTKGYFDQNDSEEDRYNAKVQMNNQRTKDFKNKEYIRGGGCLPLPVDKDLPFYVKDYSEYYKGRAYHKRSLNSNEGWNIIGQMSYSNTKMLTYSHEIRSAVLIIHGEKAHSCYMGKDAYKDMTTNSQYTYNKELMIIPNAVHTDLYDNLDIIPFDKIVKFLNKYL